MNLKSIRWRLPLSYAGIALLAALVLGSIMLLVLDGYYARQERDYLLGNAVALQPMVENALKTGIPSATLQANVNGLAFLSQTRIRVLDGQGKIILDTGLPDSSQVIALSEAQPGVVALSMTGESSGTISQGVIQSNQAGEGPTQIITEGTVPPSGVNMVVSVSASPYGYAFTNDASANPTRRSSQVVSLALADSLGKLEISNGPAIGWQIVHSVSLAWAGASGIAILLSALAGMFASRQVTRPVLALTDVTQRMEGGDLSVRVNLPEKRPATEFQALAHSFNGMAQRVEDTVSTLRAFVADAAHELHTPLTALHTDLELAADEPDPSRRILFLGRAQEQTQRLESMVSELLDLSRIEVVGKLPDTRTLELNPFVRELGEQFEARAEQSGRFLTLDLPPETIRVRADDSQLRQILNNLLENALKFTPAGGTITLKLVTDGSQAVLSVVDTGIGIPPEDLPHLFERFHRGRNASRYPGSGLGLAIVKAMVEAQGGIVRAVSEVGVGTSMIVELPEILE